MIKKFKKKHGKIILKVILLIIITSIIFTSISNHIIKINNDYIIKINKEKVTFIKLINKYKYEINQQKIIYGNKFLKLKKDKNFINKIQTNIIEQFINEILLKQYTKKLNFKITDDKIKNFILNDESFKINGLFNNNKYLIILKKINLTVNQYIKILKDKILIKEIIENIKNSNFILNKEIKILTNLLNQKRIVQIAKINLKNYKYKNKIEIKKQILQTINKLNKGIYINLNKLKIKFNKKKILTLSKKNDKNINKIIFNLQTPINNKPIYYLSKCKNNKNILLLIKLIKVYYDNIDIRNIKINDFKEYNKQMEIEYIMSNLTNHANIKYNKNIK
ncbi:SurA N-terminal domain-containing protein [Candidatus Purcelliella pentastirinorum]|uniref:SurA N-terminal domain-containing protein n=1 Tax=Candidatus Purcelliella pentastirinorum TaxID=472834 RepID=A0AAX3N953_9ENTR|nr:SurA N-terminal domain-containing protein [Candidatus Purcelliella pentastirinorum]WDI78385.1 SurA N-terminal domain-containing protein [Candidatus Purcelliella pentastirinorum]WDR80589.1 SurA N-terminal domain-containing protein [Candidatus Purcelliella pentastirinorum]